MNDTKTIFVLRGELRDLITVNIIGAVLGVFILLFFISLPNYGITFFFAGSLILVIWMVVDVLVWKKRGVQELHISPSGIKVFRGENRIESIVLPGQITGMYFNKKGYRKSINIMLGQKVKDIPGIITIFPGKRVYLTSDAFSDKEFEVAIELLEKYFKEQTMNTK